MRQMKEAMRLKADDAWRKAAQCARLAQEADDHTERDLYLRMRDAWITVANRYEFFDDQAEPGAMSEADLGAAGPPSRPFLPLGPRGR
jgi:hypothetical protein